MTIPLDDKPLRLQMPRSCLIDIILFRFSYNDEADASELEDNELSC